MSGLAGLHYWECERCSHGIDFRQPELPDDAPNCEMNESKKCPRCDDADMYFDEYERMGKLITPTDLPEDGCK